MSNNNRVKRAIQMMSTAAQSQTGWFGMGDGS